MRTRYQNSNWDRWTLALETVRDRVNYAFANPTNFPRFMQRYKPAVLGYLSWFLVQHKILSNDTEISDAAAQIWEILVKEMRATLAAKWGRGDVRFRQILRDSVHNAYYRWHKMKAYMPDTKGLILPGPETEVVMLKGIRETILANARERLKKFQAGRAEMGNRYFTVFTVWEGHCEEPYASINRRLTETTGGDVVYSIDAFRQTLGRSLDTFGCFVLDEAKRFVAERGGCRIEDCREFLEELDLFDTYISRSKRCRVLLTREGQS